MKRIDRGKLLSALFLISVFILAIIKIEDTDAWMHLSLGRAIWEHHGLSFDEPYVYPKFGSPFMYSTWLFGLIYYLAYHFFDIYGVIVLKATTVTTACYILLKTSLRPCRNYVISVIVLSLTIIMVRHRFVERPDTFLMVFLSFSIFSLDAFVSDNRKYIYALPIVHLLWANTHSSINLMVVPFLAYIAGGVTQQLMAKKGIKFSGTPSSSQVKVMLLILALSFAASLLNPSAISQHTAGVRVIAADWWRQEVYELAPPTWAKNKSPYLMTMLVILSFLLNRKRASLTHLFLAVPFIILAFVASRFIFLLGIAGGPLVAKNLSSFLASRSWDRSFSKRTVVAAATLWVFLYALLAIGRVEPFGSAEKISGFGINYSSLPEGALQYMDRKGISGRVFNLFQWGGYINWRDFPKRTVFVDPRGSLPVGLLEKSQLVRGRPLMLDDLEREFGFDSILIEYPSSVETVLIDEGVDYGVNNPQWALVYWDDVSLLYLKKGGRQDGVISEDAYRFVKPANGTYGLRSALRDQTTRDNVIRELRRNEEATASSKASGFLGFVYNEMGLYREAIDAYSKVGKGSPEERSGALSGIADACMKLGDVDKAIDYYKRSFSVLKDAATLSRIGTSYAGKGNKELALKYFEEALGLNPNLPSLYPTVVSLYQELGKGDKAKKTLEKYEKVRMMEQGEQHFTEALRAYSERRFDAAIREFKKSLEIYPSNPAAYSNIGYVYYDMNLLDKAYEYQKHAADIDPAYGNAQYGLALVYKKWGDIKMAKKHWEEYLRLEPAGYYSRRAKEEIMAIEGKR